MCLSGLLRRTSKWFLTQEVQIYGFLTLGLFIFLCEQKSWVDYFLSVNFSCSYALPSVERTLFGPEEPKKPRPERERSCPLFCDGLEKSGWQTFCSKYCTKEVDPVMIEGSDDIEDLLRANRQCSNKHRFSGSDSETYKKDGKTFKISYGTGSAKGFFGSDLVCVS